MKNLEIKLDEKTQRIKELNDKFAGKEEIDRLKEELKSKTEKIDVLEKFLSDSKGIARSLEEKLAGNEMKLEEHKNFSMKKILNCGTLKKNLLIRMKKPENLSPGS